MNLEAYKLQDEDYILSRYETILKKQNISTVYDLLLNFPTRYLDFCPRPLKEGNFDDIICLEGTVCSKITVNYLKSKLSTVVFTLEVEGERIRCTIFNRIYLKTKINYGSVIRVSGHFYQTMKNFTVNDLIILDEVNKNLVPVYKVKDIALDKYYNILEKCYRRYKNKIDETLPSDLIKKHDLISFKELIYYMHFADSMEEISKALYRAKYEELLNHELSMSYLNFMRKKGQNGAHIKYKKADIDNFIKSLPYELTDDQKRTIDEVLGDLDSEYAMNRLIQGEVGSGKTVVAMAAMLACFTDNYQSVLMCPTSILARQHYETLSEMFKDVKGLKIGLLTGSTKEKERKELLQGISDGSYQMLIGTHALFQSDVIYHNLGLVVTDEEHRFGVHQRVLIRSKGEDVNYLKMSATPIPRTLAISCYGDTDISIIKTMPKSRKTVITKVIDKDHKRDALNKIKEELDNKHQVYVVTPLIEESENIDTDNAIEIYSNMQKYFKGYTVGLIHGRLKPAEKDEIMEKFVNGDIQMLVATSVIEVGVNVPNATTILILGAERFGVATLHQLRGRVMRSSFIPYCFLYSDNMQDSTYKRLKMVEENADGFKLAEYDLATRGPGEFFGEKQAGNINFKYADLEKDKDLLEEALEDAKEILRNNYLDTNEEYATLSKIAKTNYNKKIEELD